MRPASWADVARLAQWSLDLPRQDRAGAIAQVIAQAQAADRYRKRWRRPHPDWGDGSLAQALPRPLPACHGFIGTHAECEAVVQVLQALRPYPPARHRPFGPAEGQGG